MLCFADWHTWPRQNACHYAENISPSSLTYTYAHIRILYVCSYAPPVMREPPAKRRHRDDYYDIFAIFSAFLLHYADYIIIHYFAWFAYRFRCLSSFSRFRAKAPLHILSPLFDAAICSWRTSVSALWYIHCWCYLLLSLNIDIFASCWRSSAAEIYARCLFRLSFKRYYATRVHCSYSV
jgi:hypothetical protein